MDGRRYTRSLGRRLNRPEHLTNSDWIGVEVADEKLPQKRGRPRNEDDDDLRAQDEAIARTVHVLSMYGYSLIEEIPEVVGRLAAEVIARTDHKGRALGADRVLQIYKAHRQAASVPIKPGRLTKKSRVAHRPENESLDETARRLLRHGGREPRDANNGYIAAGFPFELTDAAEQEIRQLPRLKRSESTHRKTR